MLAFYMSTCGVHVFMQEVAQAGQCFAPPAAECLDSQ